jgi:hypothetical protein
MNAHVRNRRRRGLVLIVVISCLAALALVGVTFSILNSLERTTAGNYRLTVQARLVARSGVEFAVSRLSGSQSLASALVDGGDWKYYGNDTTGFEPKERDVSLPTAKRPSYALLTENNAIDRVRLKYDNKQILSVGLSGRMKGGEYFKDGNIYSLEVRDLSGCLYVNDGLKMQGGNRSSVSENLRRILNVFARETGFGGGSLGDLILTNRPAIGGYATWHHLATMLKNKGGFKDEEIARLEPFLTVHGWTDPNVVNPVPFGPSSSRFYPVRYNRGDEGVYRRGAGKDNRNMVATAGPTELGWVEGLGDEPAVSGTTATVYGLDELFPSYVEVVHRAPVNINAAPVEVLIALIADVRGVFLMERRSGAPLDLATPDIAYQTTQWVTGAHQFVIPQSSYTWEYMGHTYSADRWSAPNSINENKKWDEPMGATTEGPPPPGHGTSFDRDELGVLTSTIPFSATGSSRGASARVVASEIIRCREAQGDYANLPFGGPFKTWSQFHAFCDHLVKANILADDRFPEDHRRRQGSQALADALKANFNPNFTPNEINPDRNLYLMVDKTDLIVNSTEFCLLPTGHFQINSLGRILREDKDTKSDTPVYEVAAMAGMRAVVQVHELYRETSQRHFYRGDSPAFRPEGRSNSGHTVETGPESDNGPLLYGDHFNKVKQILTRELDGDAIHYERDSEIHSGWGYEASGYLALPTAGGPEETKEKEALQSTWQADPGGDAADGIFPVKPAMHAHFRYDDRLHWNQSGRVQLVSGGDERLFQENMASVLMSGSRQIIVRKVVYNPATCSAAVVEVFMQVNAAEKALNFPDPDEDSSGDEGASTFSPYDPTDGIRYRMVRSFRLPLEGKGGDRPPLTRVAPVDLRADGFYVERHSGLAYWIDEQGSAPQGEAGSFDTRRGVAQFWFKPGFDPRYSGKVRSIASASRYHRANYHYRNPSPFTLFYFPSFMAGEVESSAAETVYTGDWPQIQPDMEELQVHGLYFPTTREPRRGLSQVARSSLVFQVAWGTFEGTGWDMESIPGPANASMPGPVGMLTPPATAFELYGVTPSLNRSMGGMEESDTDFLRGHRWTDKSNRRGIGPTRGGGFHWLLRTVPISPCSRSGITTIRRIPGGPSDRTTLRRTRPSSTRSGWARSRPIRSIRSRATSRRTERTTSSISSRNPTMR